MREPGSKSGADVGFYSLAVATAAAIVTTIHFVFLVVPEEKTMGIVQKIFYFHVPSAICGMYVGAAICFFGSALYLAKGWARADAWARAGADVAVAMGFMVLTSGPLWAKKAWGAYWTWDAQLTTSLLSVLVYVAYVVLRAFTGGGDAERSSPPRSACSARRTSPSFILPCRSGAGRTRRCSGATAVGSRIRT
ncbi:MAG: cytochrome c biogenesis protein CcsA [Polyangiaceae bacterium]